MSMCAHCCRHECASQLVGVYNDDHFGDGLSYLNVYLKALPLLMCECVCLVSSTTLPAPRGQDCGCHFYKLLAHQTPRTRNFFIKYARFLMGRNFQTWIHTPFLDRALHSALNNNSRGQASLGGWQ